VNNEPSQQTSNSLEFSSIIKCCGASTFPNDWHLFQIQGMEDWVKMKSTTWYFSSSSYDAIS
jgi:hypothetical protein